MQTMKEYTKAAPNCAGAGRRTRWNQKGEEGDLYDPANPVTSEGEEEDARPPPQPRSLVQRSGGPQTASSIEKRLDNPPLAQKSGAGGRKPGEVTNAGAAAPVRNFLLDFINQVSEVYI